MHTLMTRVLLTLAAMAALAIGVSAAQAADTPAAAPAHQVVACYFHRTVRCPTCQKISAYIEESIKTAYAEELKDGRVKISMVDFQSPKNQKLAAAYKITGPTLVIMNVKDGKVATWKPAPKVWTLVADKASFFKYVQGEVRGYVEKK
jgi:hypothetical protein